MDRFRGSAHRACAVYVSITTGLMAARRGGEPPARLDFYSCPTTNNVVRSGRRKLVLNARSDVH